MIKLHKKYKSSIIASKKVPKKDISRWGIFKIDKINHENNKINNKIARSLKTVSNNDAKNLLEFELNSNKEKVVVSKDKAGDPQIFELKISINIRLNDEEKKFESKQIYNNI